MSRRLDAHEFMAPEPVAELAKNPDPQAVYSSILASTPEMDFPGLAARVHRFFEAAAGRGESAIEQSRERSEAKRAHVRDEALPLHDDRPGLTHREAIALVTRNVKLRCHPEFRAGGPGVELVREVIREVWKDEN